MAASEYCTIADLYSYGLPRGGLPNPARLVDEVSAADDTFALDEHGFQTGDELTLRADSIDGVLPAGTAENTTYYAIRVTDNVFKVAASAGGTAVNLTSAGNRVLVAAPIPYTSAIQWASEIINDMLPAHLVPLETVPEIVRMTAAELAVGKLMSRQGAAPTLLSDAVSAAQERLKRWGRGVPLRGPNAPKRANLAARASAGYRDARGWRSDDTI
jgi:hypothetical protein